MTRRPRTASPAAHARLASRAAALALAVGAASAAAAAPAAAAPGWLAPAPFELSGTPTLRSASLGFGGGRELYMVEPPSGAPQQLGVFARDAGAGSGATPAPLTSFGSVTGGQLGGAQFAVAPSGAAVLAWDDSSPDVGRPLLMRVAYRTPDGAWQEPVTVATGLTSGASLPGQNAPSRPHVAIGADGTAVVVAEHGEGARAGELQWDTRLDASVHRPGAGGWERPVRLSAEDRSASSVHAAVADSGEITVAWADRYSVGGTDSLDDDDHTAVARRWVPSNGIWDAAQDVAHAAPSDDADELALGVAADGGAILAWERNTGAAATTVAARRDPGAGAFAVPRLVPTGRTGTGPLAAAVAPDGVATVLWRAPSVTNGAAAGIGANRAAADGSWGPARLLSGYPEQDSAGAIAFSGRDTVLAWSAFGGASQVVQGARWQAGAEAPDPTRDLDAEDGFVRLQQLAADGEGGVVALFDRVDGLRTAVFDAGAPLLRGADVPPIAYAGLPLTVRADVADRWSPPAGASWEFGDGSAPTSGATATHVFASTGTVTVTLRAQDTLGNALVRSFPVQVIAPTSGGGGGGGTPPARRAVIAPRVTLATPACPRALLRARPRSGARARCTRWRSTRAAWRSVRGTATGTTRIELRVGRRVLRANVRRGAWSLRLPALRAGATTLRLRPLDAAGKPTGRAVVKKLRLR